MPLNMAKKIVPVKSLAKLVTSNVTLVLIFLVLSSGRVRRTELGLVSPSTVPRHHVDYCLNLDMAVLSVLMVVLLVPRVDLAARLVIHLLAVKNDHVKPIMPGPDRNHFASK